MDSCTCTLRQSACRLKLLITKRELTKVEFSSLNTAAISWLSIANAKRPTDVMVKIVVGKIKSLQNSPSCYCYGKQDKLHHDGPLGLRTAFTIRWLELI